MSAVVDRHRILDAIVTGSRRVPRLVNVGGASKEQLLMQLTSARIKLNEAAQTLLSSDKFTTSESPRTLTAVELAVRHLGYTQGATMPELQYKAKALGLVLPPIELGPYLRLQYFDQVEGYWGHPITQHRAPPSSVTVASAPLMRDDEFPKGFYLRRIQGALWLRGYRSGPEHVYDPDDWFVFCLPREIG
jgi:hypothetical protein